MQGQGSGGGISASEEGIKEEPVSEEEVENFAKKLLNFSSEEEVRKRDLFSQEFCKIYIKFL